MANRDASSLRRELRKAETDKDKLENARQTPSEQETRNVTRLRRKQVTR